MPMFGGGKVLRKAHERAAGGGPKAKRKVRVNQIVPLHLNIKCFVTGPPGSCKADLVAALCRSTEEGGLGTMQLTIGEAQRMAIRESVALGKEVATELARRAAANKPEHMLTQKATPVLESLNMRVMAWALKEQPLLREAGVVLDGYPATRQQANSLRVQGMELSRLVVVEESDEALLASARSRRIDLTGRRMYHMDGRLGLPVPAPGDLKLLQRLQTRPQDDEACARARVGHYRGCTEGLEAEFERVLRVDGSRPVSELAADVARWLASDKPAPAPESAPQSVDGGASDVGAKADGESGVEGDAAVGGERKPDAEG